MSGGKKNTSTAILNAAEINGSDTHVHGSEYLEGAK
jgi:hypothetical protein